MVLLATFVVALLSLSGSNTTPQFVAMAWPGLIIVAGIWLTGLLIGQRNGSGNVANEPSKPSAPIQPPASPPPAPMNANGGSLPVGTVAPAPEIKQMMDDLMGGAK